MFGNILLWQNMLILRNAGPRMLSVILLQKLLWMKHFQSSSTYFRASWSCANLKQAAGIIPYIVINKKIWWQACCIHKCTESNGLNAVKGKNNNKWWINFSNQISHQAISCITCKCIKARFRRKDKTIAYFFYENGISFNVDESTMIHLVLLSP